MLSGGPQAAAPGRLLNPPEFTGCFVCGMDNPDGLRLPIHQDGDDAVARYVPAAGQVGYPGRFHGGLVGLLVDELLVYAGVCHGLWSMTARVGYRLRAPIAVGEPVDLRARVTRHARGAFRAEVQVECGGRRVAEGEGLCVIHDAAALIAPFHSG